MEIKNGEVLVYDSVKNGIHIFTDIENDNFSYKQFVSYPEGYTTAASLNGIIYIASKDKLTSYTLSSTNELVALDNVELSFGTELIELRAVGNSLIIQTPNELFLYELTVIEKPTLLVSFLIKNNELMNAVFQFMDNKLVATTRQSIQFYQINKAPTPLVNKITLDEDSTLESASIFTDAEADMITLTVTEQSTNGTISVDENGLTYTPNNNFNGEDTVTIKATDIHGNFIEHLVNIVVEPTNDSPVVSDESYTLMQGTIHSGELPVKDIDNDSLTYTIVTDVEHGSLTLSTDGQFSYSADAAYSGTDSVAYSVTDGVNTAQATISFTVQAKPPETEVEDSAESSGGSINSLMIFILLWNITLRFRKTNAYK
jgi:VCBS repeat-containing protein